ncbi:MAG: hypothetical protein KME43_17775 [Myxacorys chilensis ATA2-1-KO14]|jgi:ABC-type multidrug transport system permease subunit|nr:hypothetical protein [Myxacorys chilensis ATA2-1-KO14]
MSQRNETTQILKGILLLFGVHILALFVGAIVAQLIFFVSSSLPSPLHYNLLALPTLALIGWGVAQLVYVIPLVIYLNRKRQFGLMKGVIIGAVLTALLNGGCWILFLGSIK